MIPQKIRVGHNRTHAPQQSEPLFDHLISEREKRPLCEAERRSLEVLTGSSGLVYGFQRFTKNVFRPIGWSKLEIAFWRCSPRAVRPAAHG
jgi:hypothetical protein